MRNFLLTVFFLQFFFPGINAQEWIVPDDRKEKLSTFPFDESTRQAGEKLYTINCMSCHGTPGKADFLNLSPSPGDPATEKIQINSDGELFYKISTGRIQMPAFRSILSSSEIWNIISYIRSLNSSYKQQVMPVITSSAYPGALIRILLSYNVEENAVLIKATADKENIILPVTGAEVMLFAHRAFGLLPVDEAKTTDTDGIATFKVPDNLPGDSAGNILISARFTNEEIFGSVSKDTVLRVATKTIPVNLVTERAMWNNVRKAPIWIILSYGLGVLAAWGFIIYVLMKLRDIFIVGKNLTSDIPENKDLSS